MSTLNLKDCAEALRALAEVIRHHGTCAPSALETVADKLDPLVPRETPPAPFTPVFIFAGSALQARAAAYEFGIRPSAYQRVVGVESIAGVRGGVMYLYGTYNEYPRSREVIAEARARGFEIRGRFPTVTYRFVGKHGSTGEELDVKRSFTDEPEPFTADSKASDWGYNYFDKGAYRISEVSRETY